MTPVAPVDVVDYDLDWPRQFEALRMSLADALGDLALAIEHVGSTAVSGLAAKPIIDIDVVIADRSELPAVVERLSSIGYRHEGDLGISGREAFRAPDGPIAHHLYVCDRDNVALHEHLLLRDYLRSHPGAIQEYAELKRRLAVVYRDNRDGYTEAKTAWIRECLAVARGAKGSSEPS